jgi:hypothetical protein
MEVSSQPQAPAALIREKSPQCLADRMLGGLQNMFGRFEEQEKVLHLMGIEP